MRTVHKRPNETVHQFIARNLAGTGPVKIVGEINFAQDGLIYFNDVHFFFLEDVEGIRVDVRMKPETYAFHLGPEIKPS